MTYQANIPQPNDFLDESQSDLLNNFTVLDSSFAKNHYTFSDLTTNAGKHKFVELVKQALPATAVGSGSLYTFSPLGASNETNLAYTPDNGGIGYVLTRVIAASSGVFSNNTNYPQVPPIANQFGGWTFLAGGMLLQYGTADLAANPTATTIKYPVAFTNGVYSITVSKISSDVSQTGQEVRVVPTPNLTQFQIIQSSSSNNNKIYWMAIGV